jgi:hypothetical protein
MKNFYNKHKDEYKLKTASYREKNKDVIKIKKKEDYEKNKQKYLLRNKLYYNLHKTVLNEQTKKYYILHRDKILLQLKKYHESHKKEFYDYNKKYREKNRVLINIMANNYNKERKKIDVSYKIKTGMRSRINMALRHQYTEKAYKTKELLGCDMEFFRHYIEKQFKEEMSWENYGYKGWHLDHIIPCSSFLLEDSEQQKLCFHYSNYQPLWWYENFSKKSKIIEEELLCSIN